MYIANCSIKGTAPLLQHKFSTGQLETMMQGSTKKTGASDYSLEWMGTMYSNSSGFVCQPAAHIEGSMVKAASSFKIKGRSGKTWKDPIRAYCYVTPDEVTHLWNGEPVPVPGPDLVASPVEPLSVSIMRVKVQSAAVARSRLMIATGWELAFTIEVHDEQVRPDVLQEILQEAGRAVGIGDFRPRYGRFEVVRFEVSSNGKQ